MGQHQSLDWYKETFKNGLDVFDNAPIFIWRAETISDWIKQDGNKSILEYAAGGTILAQKTIAKCPEINYQWDDFLPMAVDNAKNKLKCKITSTDIERDYKSLDWNVDGVVSVSNEHLDNDIEILNHIKEGTNVYLSCPTIDAEDHLRILDTEEKIKERYSTILDIETIVHNDILRLVKAKRNGHKI